MFAQKIRRSYCKRPCYCKHRLQRLAEGMTNCIDTGKCTRKELNIPSGERYELCEAVHAEQNAIINGSPERMKDATIYIAGFEENGDFANGAPCKLCNRMIRNAQIKEVVYLGNGGNILKINNF